ncbi:MAG TPA: CCA tRNA nucleotidyltransferase [Acidimicrobiales bacterium]|nr:CCA tRNA nucleotidyltransferase [Acidimicrobiales bacterium]
MQSSTVPERFRPLVDATATLAQRFRRAGYRIYLVGGSVRDALVDRSPAPAVDPATTDGARDDGAGGEGGPLAERDYDLTTDARPDDIERVVHGWADAVWTQGKRFGTIGCRVGSRTYEITTHRAEAYRPDSRKPHVTFGDDIETDLSRRDFTVNAMALELPDLRLVDPFDGLADLAAHRLRTPLDPEVSFDDDPLRMLRAARFAAAYRLAPDAALVAAVKKGHHRLAIVSAERIRDELDKILVLPAPGPSRALGFVVETGLAEEFLPELPGLRLEQDPVHRHKDVLAHTLAVVDRTPPDRLLRLAALFHDVGKPRTRAIGPEGVTFHHHDEVGARMTRKRMEALRYPNDDVDTVTELVKLHLRFHTYRLGWSDRAVRRYVRDAGTLLDRLNELTRADCTTRNVAKARALSRRMDELERRITELREQEELDAIRPDLNGTQVMALLGIPPGPLVGQALAYLLELRLDEGPLGADEAGRRLDEWWAARQSPPSSARS